METRPYSAPSRPKRNHTGTRSNRSGGVQGGISNGETIYVRVAFKPTSTIGQIQKTVTRGGEETQMRGKGRHDPCVLPRAVPMVEAMIALTLADALMCHIAQCGSLAPVIEEEAGSFNPLGEQLVVAGDEAPVSVAARPPSSDSASRSMSVSVQAVGED